MKILISLSEALSTTTALMPLKAFSINNTLMLKAKSAIAKYNISTGTHLGLSSKAGNITLHVIGRNDFQTFSISSKEAKNLLKEHARKDKQTITLKNAWNLAQAIFFREMQSCTLKTKKSDKDGVVGYWDQSKRVLALDISVNDWFGDLLHEMCHQHLEDTKGLVMKDVHDSRFTKLATSVGAKIYDLSKDVEEVKAKTGFDRVKLKSNWSKTKQPEFITTFDEDGIYVGAVLAHDKNNVLYVLVPNVGLLRIAPAGQFEATKRDIASFKKFYGTRYKEVIEANRQKILKMKL